MRIMCALDTIAIADLSDFFRHILQCSLNVGNKFIGFRKQQAHQITDNHSYKSIDGCTLHSDPN